MMSTEARYSGRVSHTLVIENYDTNLCFSLLTPSTMATIKPIEARSVRLVTYVPLT